MDSVAGQPLSIVPCRSGRPGLGTYPVYVHVRLVREEGPCYREVVTPENSGALAASLLADSPREVFLVLCLDGSHRVNAVHQVSLGTIDSCPAGAREVFQAAILANAAAVILAHNHPSGDPTPSTQDVLLSTALCDAGCILGIPVLDHVVVGEGRWIRMRDLPSARCCQWAGETALGGRPA